MTIHDRIAWLNRLLLLILFWIAFLLVCRVGGWCCF
jgi:hypothetical protein